MGNQWLAPSPAAKYGGSVASPTQAATPDATAVTAVAPAVTPSLAGFADPKGPTFWFGALAALTVGLMAYSTVVPITS